MTVRELVDCLTDCDDDAEIKLALYEVLHDAKLAINSELVVALAIKDQSVNCTVCGQLAVAAPFANELVCYDHWNNFKETR